MVGINFDDDDNVLFIGDSCTGDGGFGIGDEFLFDNDNK